MLTIIRKRWVMLCLFLMLGVFDYYSWTQLSIEAYPDIADVTSQVVTQVPGLAAEEVEQQITIPLERAINGLPGMHVMRSKSTFGLSMITIVFKDGTEDYWSRQRVQERLNEVELPYGAVPGLDPLTSPIGEVYRYLIESDKHSLRELTDLQDWVVIPRIKEVSGVADVTNFGGITTQFQVEVDPRKLEQYDLSLAQVIEAIENNNANVGGSVLNRGNLGYVVRGIGLIEGLDDLGKIVVSSEGGVPIFLNDLGTLKYGNLERKGVFGYSDRTRQYSESLEGIVLLLKHENPSEVLDGIHAAVSELNNSILPEGVRIHVFLDRTSLVNTTLSTVSHTLMMGMALVVLVLILFLGNWRGALLVSVTIPIALLIAFILMKLTDIPANLLSLGAIDFGIIVDGAIVMMETILKKREDHQGEYIEEKSIAQRAREVGKPILFSTVIIITAYLPLFAFERVERKLFTPMAFTMSYAMIGALLVALLLIPGIAYAIYRKPRKIYKNRWLERLRDRYAAIVEKILRRPRCIMAPVAVILIAGIVLSITVGKDFLPTLDEGSIWLQVNLPPGISVEKSREMSDTLRARTMKYPEVTYIAVQAGRNDDGTDPFTPSHFEVSVGIKPYDQWPKGKTKEDLIEELAAEYETLPGFRVGFSQPMIDGVMDKIAGAHSELVVKVYGNEPRETRRIAEEVLAVLAEVPGAVDLDIDQEPPLPQLQILMDRDAIARYGLNVSDVSDLIEVAIGGKAVAQLYQGDRQYDITCKYREEARDTPEKIAALMLTSATGAKIPLSQVAEVKLSTGGKYHHPRDEPPPPDGETEPARPRPRFVPEGSTKHDRLAGEVRQGPVHHQVGRTIREPAPGLLPPGCDYPADADADVHPFVQHLRQVPPGSVGIVHCSAGALRGNAGAERTGDDAERIVRRGIHRHVRAVDTERNYHGVAHQRIAPRGYVTLSSCCRRSAPPFPPHPDDVHHNHHRTAAGIAGHRHRQRRAAPAGNGHCVRTDVLHTHLDVCAADVLLPGRTPAPGNASFPGAEGVVPRCRT